MKNVILFASSLFAVACGSVSYEVTDSGDTFGEGGGQSTTKNTTSTSSSTENSGGSGEGGSAVGGSGGGMPSKLDIRLAPITPGSKNIVAGKDVWSVYSVYEVHNLTDTELLVDGARVWQVDPNGDAEDFIQIAVAVSGAVQLTGSDHYLADYETFDLSGQGFVVPVETQLTVSVMAKTRAVLSSAAANGEWHGVSRSGHFDSLRIQSLHLAGDPLDITQDSEESEDPSPMVLRKAVPAITSLALDNYDLVNQDQQLFKVHITGSESPVGIRQIGLEYEKVGEFVIDDLRIFRGASMIDPVTYRVVVCMIDLPGSGCSTSLNIPTNFNSGIIFFTFNNYEETVVGSGNIYTINGLVSGLVPGNSVTFKMLPASNPADLAMPPTGKITNWTSFQFYIAQDGIVESDMSFLSLYGAQPNFIWSDMSEVPHDGGLISGLSQSADFTTQHFIEGMNASTTLAAP